MERHDQNGIAPTKTSPKHSPVKAVISWLVDADREYRIAQTMVEQNRNRF